ncbi:MAG: type II secretion system F family protein [Phycisphaerales bacterium JB043]
MPTYRYQVKNSSGQTQVGVLSAENAGAAATTLRNQGHHVLDLRPLKQSRSSAGLSSILSIGNKPGAKHVLDFTTQLAVMIRAGISLRGALEGIADQTEHPGFKKIIEGLKTDVESGKQFSDALARHPKLFGPLYINMVRASEVSGSFAKMLQRIAMNLQQQIETRKMVIGAMIYPGIIGTMAVGVTVFLLTFVLPKFAGVFEGKEHALPIQTKLLMALSNFMVEQWPLLIGTTVVSIVGLFLFGKTEVGSWWYDRLKLVVPVFKTMFRSLYISRSLNTMGELINAGVPMLDTIAITGDISGNKLFKRMWLGVYGNVKEGKKIAYPLQRTTLLPKAVVQMIAAGEESGKLGEVLMEVSDFYGKRLKENIKAVTSMIEPIMIIVMGSVVGFIAMAIILPIFKMSQIVG